MPVTNFRAVVIALTAALMSVLPPQDVELYGIDGLYIYKEDLIAVQNGIKPWRLMRFVMNEDLTEITEAITLELGNTAITATTGAIVDDEIRLIGQGPANGAVPTHIPETLRDYVGRTAIMTAPLD